MDNERRITDGGTGMVVNVPEITYVYDGVEVRKTGRKAKNTTPSSRTNIIYEITPIDSITGTWKKWVRDDALYTVDN